MTAMTGHVELEIVEGPRFDRDSKGWEHYAYRVRLNYEGRSMEVDWKQGTEITDDPTAREVLENLFLDAAGSERLNFEDWASEYDYDTDSREAERIFKATKSQTNKLRSLLRVSLTDPPWANEDAEELAKRLTQD